MADPDFQEVQRKHRLDGHIAPINEFVISLRGVDGRGWIPEVAPLHGGVDAQILSVLRDPGPKTQDGSGSGFLCIENDDPTAEAQAILFQEFGVPLRTVLPWNAYPWYIDRKPSASELEAGARILGQLIELVPSLQVVLLQGNDAASAWRRLKKQQPGLVEDRRIDVVRSIHPGRQALWTPHAHVRAERIALQRRAYEQVARILSS